MLAHDVDRTGKGSQHLVCRAAKQESTDGVSLSGPDHEQVGAVIRYTGANGIDDVAGTHVDADRRRGAAGRRQ